MQIHSNEPWVHYLFQIFEKQYVYLKDNDIKISYNKPRSTPGITIISGNRCQKTLVYNDTEIPILHANDTVPLKGESVAFYSDGSPAISYQKQKGILQINADILLSSYILLSRKEEMDTTLDRFGRFRAKNSINADIKMPLVNVYFHLLYTIINQYFLSPDEICKFKTPWPNNAPYAVCLTHDVDNIYKWNFRRFGSYIFKKQQIQEICMSVGRKEYFNFEKIMDLEKSYNYYSTFFFLTQKRDFRTRYNIKRLKKQIRSIHHQGWEVALHGGYSSYKEISDLHTEIKTLATLLGDKIHGIRNHYLKFEAPISWTIQSKQGLLYDSTLGYPTNNGFRSGYCLPYHPYDYQRLKKIDIIEIPMNIMDNTLLRSDTPLEDFKKFLQWLKKFHGLLVLNWHQCRFDEKDFPDHTKVYEKILREIKKDQAYVSSCVDIVKTYLK